MNLNDYCIMDLLKEVLNKLLILDKVSSEKDMAWCIYRYYEEKSQKENGGTLEESLQPNAKRKKEDESDVNLKRNRLLSTSEQQERRVSDPVQPVFLPLARSPDQAETSSMARLSDPVEPIFLPLARSPDPTESISSSVARLSDPVEPIFLPLARSPDPTESISSSVARLSDPVEPVFFPLARLPNPAMTKILKMLSLWDRKNMRLVSRWLNDKVTYLNSSVRKWKIDIEQRDYERIREILDNVKKKHEHAFLRFYLHIDIDDSNNLEYKEDVFTWLETEWSPHIQALTLTIGGDEGFLFSSQFTFTNLQYLCFSRSGKRQFCRRKKEYSKDESCFDHAYYMWGCQLRESMISRHASTLKYLELQGNWKLNLELSPLKVVETISMVGPSTQAFKQLINSCGESLTTVKIKDALDEYVHDLTDTIIPSLHNILIDSYWPSWVRLIEAYAPQLITLKIESFRYDILDFTVDLPKLKTLYVRNEVHGMHVTSFLNKCRHSLQCLIVESINFECCHLPNLTDLYVLKRDTEESGEPSNVKEMLDINSNTLEFLFLSDGKPSIFEGTGIEEVTNKFAELDTILLPGCVNDQLLDVCRGKERRVMNAKVSTLRNEVNEEVSRRAAARSYSLCPRIVPFVDFGYTMRSLPYYHSS